MLPKSKILKQLESLDLSMSHITTDVLKRDILPHKAAFSHLASLSLMRCRLDKEGEKLAKQLCKNVDVSRQDRPSEWEDEDYRYAAVGE